MTVKETTSSNRWESLSSSVRRTSSIGTVIVSGVLIGLGALALTRGLHMYTHFYSYATGIATTRLYQLLFWSIAGGIVLSIGIFVLANSLVTKPST